MENDSPCVISAKHSGIFPNAKMEIDRSANIRRYILVDLSGNIYIGPYVDIHQGTCIFTHKHHWRHSRGKRSEIERITAHNLTIEEDAFIGTNAMLICVNRIGKGAVVAAGAVLTKDVGDYEIWAGNPAQCVGVREDEK